jgi:hypothetical protein
MSAAAFLPLIQPPQAMSTTAAIPPRERRSHMAAKKCKSLSLSNNQEKQIEKAHDSNFITLITNYLMTHYPPVMGREVMAAKKC